MSKFNLYMGDEQYPADDAWDYGLDAADVLKRIASELEQDEPVHHIYIVPVT